MSGPLRGGRTANFIRGFGKSRVYADGGTNYDGRMDFNFTSNRSRAIRRVSRNFQHRLGAVDNDIQMDGEQQARNFQSFRGGRGGGRGGFRGNQRQRGGKHFNRRDDTHSFGPGWHKITIMNGCSYDRDFVLNSIASLSGVSFQPVAYSRLGVNAAFFVESRTAAEGVAACSGKFSGPDSQPILLRVETYGPPPTATLDEKVEVSLKSALAPRYTAAGPALNLSNFSNSPQLVRDYYLPLFRPSVATKVFNILCEVLPTLAILDLSNNRLTTLESFQKLGQLTPNLKALNLSDNKLRDIFLLERIKGLPLLEIILDKNPLTEKFQKKDEYIRVWRSPEKSEIYDPFRILLSRALRKYFPKVTKVDGIDSPPPPDFDVEEDKSIIPSILPGFSCNEEARRVVGTFVDQYFKIYDTDNREPLFSAYHEDAILTIQSWQSRMGNEAPNMKLTNYLAEGRNSLRNQDMSRMDRCYHKGKLDIVAFLSRLPKTTHDINAFVIDLTLALPTLINFSVTGCFKERGGPRDMALRYFHRTFLLVPLNQGFVIIDEMLFVTNATNEQIKASFSQPTQTPIPSPAPAHVPLPTGELPNIPSLSLSSDTERRALMIKQFAKESTMNEAWAEKCLDQNGWDYEKSALVFTELHKNGSIPADAFVK